MGCYSSPVCTRGNLTGESVPNCVAVEFFTAPPLPHSKNFGCEFPEDFLSGIHSCRSVAFSTLSPARPGQPRRSASSSRRFSPSWWGLHRLCQFVRSQNKIGRAHV